MPRHRRVVLLGCPHHVTQRGNNRRDVFFSDEDRQVYLALLREYSLKYGVGIVGFCLMTNHIHLIAVLQGRQSCFGYGKPLPGPWETRNKDMASSGLVPQH
jgi:putative transposase